MKNDKIFMIKKEGYKPIFIEEKEYMDLDYIECKIESICNDKGMFNYFIDLNCSTMQPTYKFRLD